MVRVIVQMMIKNEKVEEFLKLTKILVEESRKEKGCLEYTLVPTDNPNCFYFIEKWETREDLEVHANSTHSKEIGPQLAPLKSENFPIEVYEMV